MTITPPIRRVRVFTIVALALMMMSVDTTIVATALHSLTQGLGTSINRAGWTITAYRHAASTSALNPDSKAFAMKRRRAVLSASWSMLLRNSASDCM